MKEAEDIEPANLRRDMVVSLSPTNLCPCSLAIVIPSSVQVHREGVRTQPPQNQRKRWTVGDDAEIFDFQCWRESKIAKVLKNDFFVVRLFGSIQLKEFHESNLRIQQAWRNNNWSVARSKEYTKNCAENKSKRQFDAKGSSSIGVSATSIYPAFSVWRSGVISSPTAVPFEVMIHRVWILPLYQPDSASDLCLLGLFGLLNQ
ncbi:hypothetical protein DKX38_002120 [Salix brachista]|uniref:Agenet domain-containing protein n=1 Tax=Salix brachista TaxID=2182728 RepID=A0A5N5NMR8_9ROSI|nr:hypothetical protein DKX38_002120 [Salix brachista]